MKTNAKCLFTTLGVILNQLHFLRKASMKSRRWAVGASEIPTDMGKGLIRYPVSLFPYKFTNFGLVSWMLSVKSDIGSQA